MPATPPLSVFYTFFLTTAPFFFFLDSLFLRQGLTVWLKLAWKTAAILMSQLPMCWDYKLEPFCPASFSLLSTQC